MTNRAKNNRDKREIQYQEFIKGLFLKNQFELYYQRRNGEKIDEKKYRQYSKAIQKVEKRMATLEKRITEREEIE